MPETLHVRAFRKALSQAQNAVVFTDSAARTFTGILSPARPDDPRLAGASDRVSEVVAITADLPVPVSQQGDTLVSDSVHYRIHRADADSASGLTSFLITV